jgi:two-component system OmpR family sensor kinase
MRVTLRLRLAVLFGITSAAIFSLGGWLLVANLSAGLLSSIDTQLGTVLSQAGAYLPSSTHAGEPGRVTTRPDRLPGELLVQVIDSNGVVRGASQDAGTTPLISPAQLVLARKSRLMLTSSSTGDRARLAAEPFRSRAGWVAVASASLDTFDDTMSEVSRELLVGGIAFVAIAGTGAYGLARAALGPVERLRRQVASRSERDDQPGLQVPNTGDEIAALASTMNDLLSRLHGALARQRAFVADASHELRTPFAVLRGELELAGRPGRTVEDLRLAVASAADEAARLNRLTDDLLVLARSDSDRMGLRLGPTDLGALLEQTATRARLRAEPAGVACRVDVAPGIVAEVDVDRIRQAVDNLVDNALHFAPTGTEVVLSARTSDAGGVVTIGVADSGPGFPADFLPHAFERFRRPDNARARSDGGSGLGLAIVSAVAKAHGGQAIAQNRDDGGAIVSITVPVAPSRRGLGRPPNSQH